MKERGRNGRAMDRKRRKSAYAASDAWISTIASRPKGQASQTYPSEPPFAGCRTDSLLSGLRVLEKQKAV
jgi:hypothetical protein